MMKPSIINGTIFSVMIFFVFASCTENKGPESASETESLTESIENGINPLSEYIPNSKKIEIKKLDSLLSRLVNNSEKNLSIDPQQIDSQLSIKNEMVAIEVTYDQQQVTPESLQAFKDLGGQVNTVFLNKLYGWVPINKIRLVAKPESVWSLSASIQQVYPVNERTEEDPIESTDQTPVSTNANKLGEANNEN